MQKRSLHLGWIAHSIGLLVLLVCIAAFLVAVYRPLMAAKRQTQNRMAELERLLGTSGEARSEHHSLSVTLEELEERSQSVRQRVPQRPEEAEFLRGLSSLAEQSELTIKDYRRQGVENRPTHAELVLNVSAQGRYESICRFIHGLESMPRIATIRRLLIDAKNDTGVYAIDFTLVLYFDLKQQSADLRGPRRA